MENPQMHISKRFYYVEMNIGKPPRPYFLDPDTGSDLTWLQCDAPCVHCTKGPHPLYRPNNDLVVCKDPICEALHEGEHNCEDDLDQCDYEVEYADGGSSLGVLVNDVFLLNLTAGIQQTSRLALGCGYDQLPGANYHPLDGVLGLGKGKSSIISQLRGQGLIQNVVGHCFGGKGGGFIFFGDDVYDSSRVVWTPMSRDYSKHYSPGFAELILGGKTTGLKNLLIVFDSGSSYTFQFFSKRQIKCILTSSMISRADITMQDKMVIYDNEKQAIGWLPANCERIPKPKDNGI
ncbi:hypothetical protein LguiB_016940 [Lonicera macranthoides]